MTRIKIIALYLLSIACSIAPVLIYFFANTEKYVNAGPDVVKLSFGGIILVFIVILKVIGKLKMPSRAVLFAFVFLLSYFLESVLADLLIFSFLALVGEILDLIISAIIKKIKKDALIEESASKTAQEVEKVIKKYSGRI